MLRCYIVKYFVDPTTEHAVFARFDAAHLGGTGGVLVLHHDGVLGLPGHEPVAVQSVRPDGRDGRARGLQVR